MLATILAYIVTAVIFFYILRWLLRLFFHIVFSPVVIFAAVVTAIIVGIVVLIKREREAASNTVQADGTKTEAIDDSLEEEYAPLTSMEPAEPPPADAPAPSAPVQPSENQLRYFEQLGQQQARQKPPSAPSDDFLEQIRYDEAIWRREQIKRASEKDIAPPTPAQTVYFRDGVMYKVLPSDQDSWYDARYLVSDGKLYDLELVDDIRRIPVPRFSSLRNTFDGYGVTGELDYVLRMKAGNLYKRVEKELCSACLWKATELMVAKPHSGWRKSDYYRLVYWHDELGMFDEAEKARKYLSQFDWSTENPFDISAKQILLATMKHDPKLVVFNDYGTGCCADCAPLRGRVYSVDGRSTVFPKLPDYAKNHGNFHSGCRCMMSSYFDGDPVYYKGIEVDAVTASTRPWEDDRSPEEISAYEGYLQHVAEEEAAEEQRAIYSHEKGLRRLEFEAIQKAFPDLAPKSLTGYSRMKTQRTKNFMHLYELATQAGINIQLPDK